MRRSILKFTGLVPNQMLDAVLPYCPPMQTLTVKSLADARTRVEEILPRPFRESVSCFDSQGELIQLTIWNHDGGKFIEGDIQSTREKKLIFALAVMATEASYRKEHWVFQVQIAAAGEAAGSQ